MKTYARSLKLADSPGRLKVEGTVFGFVAFAYEEILPSTFTLVALSWAPTLTRGSLCGGSTHFASCNQSWDFWVA